MRGVCRPHPLVQLDDHARHGSQRTPLTVRGTRRTQYSVRAVNHSIDDDVDFRALVLDVENILADAIVTCVCCIGPQRGVLGLTYNNFAPRFAVSYDLTGKGETIVRAGW